MIKRYLIMQVFRAIAPGQPVKIELRIPETFALFDRIFYSQKNAERAIEEFGKPGEHFVILPECFIP